MLKLIVVISALDLNGTHIGSLATETETAFKMTSE